MAVPQVEAILAGDVRNIARAATLIENRGANELLKQLFPHTGNALILGITGSPGAGKSTLVNRFIQQIRAEGLSVAVIAVDPTSPFTGGAILGDRIRMLDHYRDSKVFIRSMATRGQLGGLAPATADMTLLLDAAGFDIIIVETVGVGQDEIEIAKLAHVSIVVLTPNTGDDIQAIKAGIMEIADLFVINKADLDGAEKLEREIKMAQNAHVPVLLTSAQEGKGVAEALAAARQCQKRPDPALWAIRLREMLRERLLEQFPQEMFETAAKEVAAKIHDPYTVIDQWLERFHQHK
jgi:LAO/AO transport system kinase